MTPPARPDKDNPPPPHSEDSPGVMVWLIAGCVLILVYVMALALLHPSA
jgi:hypothetical protein